MKKECVICGKPIRTGRKYCFEHRNYRGGNEEGLKIKPEYITLFGLFLIILSFTIKSDFKSFPRVFGLLLFIPGLIFFYLKLLEAKKNKLKKDENLD